VASAGAGEEDPRLTDIVDGEAELSSDAVRCEEPCPHRIKPERE